MRYKGVILAACAMGLICSNTGKAADSNAPDTTVARSDANVPEVKFVISAEKKGWEGQQLTTSTGIAPTLAVEIEVPEGTLARRITENYVDMYYSKSFKSLSKQQRNYYRDTIRIRWEDNKCILYAVSEDDAKLVASVFLEMVTYEYRKELPLKEDAIQRITKGLKDIEDRFAEFKKLEENKKKSRYISADEAKSQAMRFGMMRDEIAIELAGLKARLKAIDEAMQKSPNSDATKGLGKERVDTLIEMSTAEAKDIAAHQKWIEARDAYTLLSRYEVLEKDKDSYEPTIGSWKKDAAQYEKQLVELKAQFETYMQSPKTATIYSVSQNR